MSIISGRNTENSLQSYLPKRGEEDPVPKFFMTLWKSQHKNQKDACETPYFEEKGAFKS